MFSRNLEYFPSVSSNSKQEYVTQTFEGVLDVFDSSLENVIHNFENYGIYLMILS